MKKLLSVAFAVLVAFGAFFAIHEPAYADAFGASCEKITDAKEKKLLGCDDNKDSSNKVIQYIVGGVIGLAGSVALIFIILGGVRYMTANGDTTKIKKAKDTILYSAIGLIICALAFAITNWIIAILPN